MERRNTKVSNLNNIFIQMLHNCIQNMMKSWVYIPINNGKTAILWNVQVILVNILKKMTYPATSWWLSFITCISNFKPIALNGFTYWNSVYAKGLCCKKHQVVAQNP